MYRSHHCGELNATHINTEVTLAGWVQNSNDKGFINWVNLRDRYGITQLLFDKSRSNEAVFEMAKTLGREYVVQVKGTVIERESKNKNLPTGDIEILVSELQILNASLTPPFTIEDKTDGGEDIRMKYRYLDIRRNPVKNSLLFRHKVAMEVRKYLSDLDFCEVETPYLIKSTPEGARDFVVPSRMNEGQFYALPQSPQTFKQLLMVGGMDKYFQIVKCFRDEDLRADRQPEFTQIDCEMAFVEQEDILNVFEGLTRHLLKEIKGVEVEKFPRFTYEYAMKTYGNDKPDIRFDMQFCPLTPEGGTFEPKGFPVFDDAEIVLAINVAGCADYTRKQLDELTEWVKRPQIGAKGLVYARYNTDGTLKSSVDKFFDETVLQSWATKCKAKPGDLMLILSGETDKTRTQLSALRMELATRLGLRKPDEFAPLWVVDFPLLEFDEESGRYHAMHHPFTSPKPEDISLLETNPGKVRANAYDMVLNGNEIGGGSIRIHDKATQELMFKYLGFTPEEAKAQFGFLMDAFQFGAPPHGGLAFGLDRLVAILGGQETIRDFIAFPKNNSGRDVMIDAPATIDVKQLEELHIQLR
ncbi:aspartate--tRNA ligase [Flavobacterium branchiophilum]|uniref:Aspartate--tRNA ligase n=1 Tax=Flavobacterium branchiophilum TaxID=55197 RepID=A0A543G0J2_9FLAO|nr:aspartate--tRNA ligase [Flavobacterium branchiophilum]OXA72295.1 aspartate--tRNA ligase [Flavobacterium branchiophilum] [Flavobacterium branchiophilum NBRC 15030 = ATCC 35035]TQM39587.1 aspartyl-tRNA synthetase [Flavobacterium branchiophilum]TQM41133.1 aspartyl-tRNA synthetase [Flavobacterium branchiophilum]TQM42271.1 aspartyl-tRNA synthetase [Flavobacterium branchiophilum]GEM56745.1 aspartate--tRNA ligase [Flavobacterium branchiophilum NBRC 15030 = ATCC 35035]